MTLHPIGGCLAIDAIRTGPGAVLARAGPARNRVSPHTAFLCLCGASPHSLPGRPLTNDSVNENWYCESGLHSGLALPEPIDHFLTYHAGNAAASKKKKTKKTKDPAKEKVFS